MALNGPFLSSSSVLFIIKRKHCCCWCCCFVVVVSAGAVDAGVVVILIILNNRLIRFRLFLCVLFCLSSSLQPLIALLFKKRNLDATPVLVPYVSKGEILTLFVNIFKLFRYNQRRQL